MKYVGWGGLSRLFEYWKNEDEHGQPLKDEGYGYWKEQFDTLQQLLTKDEFATARNSTQNAHFTSPMVIRAMWDAVARLGVSTGSALEPSAGAGHFIGLAPDQLRSLAFAAVEKDSITAAIAKHLYPSAYVQHSGFEEARLPDGHFTVAISNVPFGLIPITDRFFVGPPFIKQRIHNYFFAKALDKVAPGGLVAFITTHGTMDSRDNRKVREYLATRADLLGAVRLPYVAFKANAGTEVVTDVIFLRKRREGEKPQHADDWIETNAVALETKEGAAEEKFVNEYFQAHPEMVLGTSNAKGKMRVKNAYSVWPPGDKTSEHLAYWQSHGPTLLAKALEHLPPNVIDTAPTGRSLAAFSQAQAPLGTRPFEFLIHEGRIAQVIDGELQPVDVTPQAEAIIRALLPVRAALRQVYDLTAEDAPQAAMDVALASLNSTYDAFVKKHGPISRAETWEAFHEDPDLPLLLSLENYDTETEKAEKTAVFTTRTFSAEKRARKATDPQHALTLALGETGTIDLDRIGELLSMPAEDAALAVRDAGLIIETPSGWQLPSVYLSGNVRVKLAEAEAAAKLDDRYEAAVERLKKVIPEDLPGHKINVRLGASWVPVQMVQDFIASIVNGHASEWTVTYTESNAKWDIDGSPSAHTSRFETEAVSTKDLLLDALNDRRRTVTTRTNDKPPRKVVDAAATALARQRKEDLHKAFGKWLLKDDVARRQWAVRTYNDLFNSYVEPIVDGSFLKFPGMATYWQTHIATHQRNAVARILHFGNTLLAHVVGAGKTLAMVAAGMEMRRTGLARKPVYVVPNHLISQFPAEFINYYPKAKLLVTTPEDLQASNRKRLTARIAAGDWDGVVMPYSAFVRISMSVEAETTYQREILDAIETAIIQAWRDAQAAESESHGGRKKKGRGQGKTPPTVKNLEKMRDRILKRLSDLAARPKDDVLTFEQLGVDAMFVDEAHNFKNLYFPTRQQAAGIPADNDAQRALDMYLKARFINNLTNNRNLVLATGTPVSNSMAEVFVMQKLLQERALERANIAQFDAWLAQFGQIVAETELDASGTGLKARPVLKYFRNLADLASMFRQVADVKMIDDLPELKAKRPKLKGGAIEQIIVPLTPLQEELMDILKHRADHLDPRDRKSDNMPMITGDGRMGMLDMRLLDRRTPDEPGNKMHVVAKTVAEIYKETAKLKGTQLIFLDAGTPGSEKRSQQLRTVIDPTTGQKVKVPPTEKQRNRGFDLYADLKKKLVKAGVKAQEIAFIHDIDSVPEKQQDGARKALFRKVKAGEIRVLIGSTNKMGTGMNVQDRLVALHNVDPAWKPSDIEQRNGRILRQGNLLAQADPDFRIRILNYIAQGKGLKFGFDAYMWQLNERKAAIIADFFSGDMSIRDTGLDLNQTVLTASEMKAAATGNLEALELGKAQAELQRLEMVKEGYDDSQREAEYLIDTYRTRRAEAEAYHQKTVKTAPAIEDRVAGADASANIGGTAVVGATKIGDAIMERVKDATTATEAHPGRLQSYAKPEQLGTYRGMTIWLEPESKGDAPWIVLRHPEMAPPRYASAATDEASEYRKQTISTVTVDPKGKGGIAWREGLQVINEINRRLDDIQTDAKSKLSDNFWWSDADARVKSYEAILDQSFEHAADLEAARERVAQLSQSLGLSTGQAAVTTDVEEGELDEGGDQPDEMQAPVTTADEMRLPEPLGSTFDSAGKTLLDAQRDIRATLAAPAVNHPSRLSARLLRRRVAQMVHTVEYARHALAKYRNAVEAMTVDHDAILDLADAVELPDSKTRVPRELLPWVKVRGEIFAQLKKQIAQLGIDRQWRDHYLGHVWETQFKGEPGKLKGAISKLIGRRPLRGPMSFLKQRTIETMRKGVEMGLEPKTWNLVEIDLYKMEEMAKFIMAHQYLKDLQARGLAVFHTALKRHPEGLAALPDPMGEVWAPPRITVQEAYDKLLMEGLENYIRGLGVKYQRKPMGGSTWGFAERTTGNITMRFGSPEFVLMHELGHALDALFGLRQRVWAGVKKNMFEGEEWRPIRAELSKLAEMRYAGLKVDEAYKKYVQKPQELIANLVHAYLHAPQLAKKVAPHWYDAFDDLVTSMPELEMLGDLQQMRSVVLGVREGVQPLPGPMLLGRYYVDPAVARIVKNYLTPGLSANKLWALVRVPANALVQAKLSFSAFHSFVVSQEATALKVKDGLLDILHGRPSGIRKLGAAVVEPAMVIRRGLKMQRQYLGTLDPLSLAADSATNLALAGGGRALQSHEFNNRAMRKFMDNLRRANAQFRRQQAGKAGAELLGAALHALPAMVEAASWPILQWLVPVVKAGAVDAQIRAELARYEGTPTDETLLAIASKAVSLTDATLGEVIWDNLFLPRALMSAVHMLIMAPGWRGGSAVILARGLTDPFRRLLPGQREEYQFIVPVSSTGGAGGNEPPEEGTVEGPPKLKQTKTITVKERYWSPYTSLMIATVMVQVLVSELFQLAHGAGHVKTIRDVAFPRDGQKDANGKPTRVRLPGYTGIFFDILRDMPKSMFEYVLGGTAPMPTALGQMYNNETIFGDEIVDSTDPWRQQLWDYAKFLKDQAAPISVTSYGRRTGTTAEKFESVLGISPAPARVTRTPLEDYLQKLQPPSHRTKDQAEKAQARRDFKTAMRQGDHDAASQAVQTGGLSPRSIEAITRNLRYQGPQQLYQTTTLPQAVRGYELASPEERALIRPILVRKATTQMRSIPTDERAELFERIKKALQLPVAQQPTAAGAGGH